MLDGDVPPPTLHVARNGAATVLNWPLTAAGFALETSGSVPGTWTNLPDPWTIAGGQNYVTSSISGGAKYFRLHLP